MVLPFVISPENKGLAPFDFNVISIQMAVSSYPSAHEFGWSHVLRIGPGDRSNSYEDGLRCGLRYGVINMTDIEDRLDPGYTVGPQIQASAVLGSSSNSSCGE